MSCKKAEEDLHKLIKATLPVPLRPRGVLSSLSQSNFRPVQNDSDGEMLTAFTACIGFNLCSVGHWQPSIVSWNRYMVFPVEMVMKIEKTSPRGLIQLGSGLNLVFVTYSIKLLCFFIFVKEGVQTGPLLSKLVYLHAAPCVPGDRNTIHLLFFFTKKGTSVYSV